MELAVFHGDQSLGLDHGRLSKSSGSCAKTQGRYSAEVQSATELLRPVPQTLYLFHRVVPGTHLKVAPLADHVAHHQEILGLLGFLAGIRQAQHLAERFHYPSGGNRRRLQRRTVFDLGKVEICRADICRCRGIVRQT